MVRTGVGARMSQLDGAQVRALRLIRSQFPPGSMILDVGFGRGEFLEHLLRTGYEVVGTEVSREGVPGAWDRLAGKGSVRLYMTEDPGSVLERPDCTTCFQVLEHLEDPVSFLRSLPLGPALFSVPNKERWWVQLTRGRYESWDRPPNHLHRFDADSLRTLLLSGGYTNVSVLPLPVGYREVLQPIYSLFTCADSYSYGIRNRSSKLKALLTGAQYGVFPLTVLLALLLTRLNYQATNLLAYGVKREARDR